MKSQFVKYVNFFLVLRLTPFVADITFITLDITLHYHLLPS